MDTNYKSRFNVLNLLGQSEYYQNFLVSHVDSGETCRMKLIRSDLEKQKEPEARVRLKREAQLLESLNHPGIVRFREYDEQDPFLVTSYPQALNLEMIVQRNEPFKLDDVLRIGIQLCDALTYLHTHEPPVLFLQLEPENIHLTMEGMIFLLNFSSASLAQQVEAHVPETSEYTAPEQLAGHPEARSDLYGLGQTLKFLVSGTRPSQMMPPDSLSASFNQLIEQLIKTNPSDRPKDIFEVSSMLQKTYRELFA